MEAHFASKIKEYCALHSALFAEFSMNEKTTRVLNPFVAPSYFGAHSGQNGVFSAVRFAPARQYAGIYVRNRKGAVNMTATFNMCASPMQYICIHCIRMGDAHVVSAAVIFSAPFLFLNFLCRNVDACLMTRKLFQESTRTFLDSIIISRVK